MYRNCTFEELKNTLEINIKLCRVCLFRRGNRLAPLLFIENGELISNNNSMDTLTATATVPFSAKKDLTTLPEINHWLSKWEVLDQDTFLSNIYSGIYI